MPTQIFRKDFPPLVQRANSLAGVPAKQLRGHNVFFVGPAGGDFFDGLDSVNPGINTVPSSESQAGSHASDSRHSAPDALGIDAKLWCRATQRVENRVTLLALASITEATALMVHRSLSCMPERCPPEEKSWRQLAPCVRSGPPLMRKSKRAGDRERAEITVVLPQEPSHQTLLAALARGTGTSSDVAGRTQRLTICLTNRSF